MRNSLKIRIRAAEEKDCQAIYEISNDPVVRQVSLNSAPIDLEHHTSWFEKQLKNPRLLFLVAEIDGIVVGQVRFLIEKTSAEISISIASNYRKLGLGSQILSESMELLKKKFTEVNQVVATVKNGNTASNNFFINNTFEVQSSAVQATVTTFIKKI